MDEDDSAEQFAAANRAIGSGAMIAGSVLLTLAIIVAVAHYIYHVPTYRRWSHFPQNPRTVAAVLIAFGITGTAAIFGGWYLRRR